MALITSGLRLIIGGRRKVPVDRHDHRQPLPGAGLAQGAGSEPCLCFSPALSPPPPGLVCSAGLLQDGGAPASLWSERPPVSPPLYGLLHFPVSAALLLCSNTSHFSRRGERGTASATRQNLTCACGLTKDAAAPFGVLLHFPVSSAALLHNGRASPLGLCHFRARGHGCALAYLPVGPKR